MTNIERKLLTIFLVELILFAQIIPPKAIAGTGGPAQPEFTTFEPVGTNDMVNEFTGSFTWNLPVIEIPGPNGSGYAMSLSYHSGTSPDAPASWVGYGWTFNPGSIVRNVRGFPDDFRKDIVTQYNKSPKNQTGTIGVYGEVEVMSFGFSANAALRYNTFKGYGYSAGLGLSVYGTLNLNYGITDGEGTFSASISPAGLLKKKGTDQEFMENFGKYIGSVDIVGGRHGLLYGEYGMHSFATSKRPTFFNGYTGRSYNFNTSIQGTLAPLNIGIEGGLTGNYNYQSNNTIEYPYAYGYLYSSDPQIGSNDMMDYFSDRERPFTRHDHFLHTPFSAADNFVLNGEGLSGSFRIYNKKPGHFRPNAQFSQTDIYQPGFEMGMGGAYVFGGNFGVGFQALDIGDWQAKGNQTDYSFADTTHDDAWFMRFSDDLGGKISSLGTSENHAECSF